MAFRPAALSEQHAGYCAGLGHFMKLFSFYFQLLLPALLHFPIVHCAAITTKRTRKRSRNNNMALCGKCATVDVTTPSFLFFFLFRRKSFHDTWNRSVNGPWEAPGPTRMDTCTKTFSGFFFPRIFHFKIAPFFCVIRPIGREMRNFLKNSCQSSRYSWVDSEPQKILSTWNNFHFSKKWNSALVPTFYFASETFYVVVYSFKDEIWS